MANAGQKLFVDASYGPDGKQVTLRIDPERIQAFLDANAKPWPVALAPEAPAPGA